MQVGVLANSEFGLWLGMFWAETEMLLDELLEELLEELLDELLDAEKILIDW